MERLDYRRDIPLIEGYDLVVCGGGPAGCAAAISAGRAGLAVLVVEATGCLGGLGTSGLVCAFDPMADGERQLVGGLMDEICQTLYERGHLGPQETPDSWRQLYHHWTQFNAEGLKLLLDELLEQAGVAVRFFTTVVDAAAADGRIAHVVLHNCDGFTAVRAPYFVDATGDAALADLAGAECRVAGRDTPRIMPATLTSLFTGIDWTRCGWHEQMDALTRALADDHFSQPDRHLPGLARNGRHLGYLNGGHVFDLDGTDNQSLSAGMRQGRRIVREYEAFYRRYVPGCEEAELVATGSIMGVRETRRIVGEYELTAADFHARRHFADEIGVFNKVIDIHPYDCSDAEWDRFRHDMEHGRLGRGECFGIPYRILVPRGWRNLWVAGRCVSTDVAMQGCIRVMPAAAMMGQAAGTAVTLAKRAGQDASGIAPVALIAALRDQGAIIHEVTEDMTC